MNLSKLGLWSLPAALALLCSACTVAPIMRPDNAIGLSTLNGLRAQEASQTDIALQGYSDFLKHQQKFDDTLQSYNREFRSNLQTLSGGGLGASIDEVAMDGMQYFYLRHVAGVCDGYFGYAHAQLDKKDYARAERAALDGLQLSDQRLAPWSMVLSTEVSAEGWATLAEIYKKEGLRGSALWASSQQRLAADRLLSDRAVAGYEELAKMRLRDQKQLDATNDVIHDLNAQKSRETANQILAGMQTMANVGMQYEQMRVNTQIASQGYATQAQTGELQVLKFDQMMNNMLLAQTAGHAGSSGSFILALNNNTIPALFQQLSNPSAGANPIAIVQTFTQQAKALAPSDPNVANGSSQVSSLAGHLDQQRQDGDLQGAANTTSQLIPALVALGENIRRVQ